MKKYKTVTVKTKEEVEVSQTCNKCGKDKESDECFSPFTTINIHFGYGSEFDLEHWDFEMCDDCIKDIIKTFKHMPNGFTGIVPF